MFYRTPSGTFGISKPIDGKPATLSLGTGQLAPAIEQCLLGLAEGAHETFHLEAGLAFGEDGRAGYVRGRSYINTSLDVALTAPRNYLLFGAGTGLGALKQGGKTVNWIGWCRTRPTSASCRARPAS